MDVTQALLKLAPGASFSVKDENYDEVTWFSEDIPQPTREEVEAKIQELRAAEPMRRLRVERDKLIAETDWWVLPDRTPTQEQLDYRQALRDITNNYTSLDNVVWPTKPN
jgi:hypothetical protein